MIRFLLDHRASVHATTKVFAVLFTLCSRLLVLLIFASPRNKPSTVKLLVHDVEVIALLRVVFCIVHSFIEVPMMWKDREI